MDRRFTLFAILVAAIFVANQIIYSFFFAPPPVVEGDAKKVALAKEAPGKAEPGKEKPKNPEPAKAAPDDKREEPRIAAAPDKPADAAEAAPPADTEPAIAPQWITLGSADPQDPYRMLVTLTNRGAAVERLELSSPRYRELEDRSGYLGHLAPDDATGGRGAVARVVGAGTPAALAGMRAGDVISAVGEKKVASALELVQVLKETEPFQEVTLAIAREGAPLALTATLGRRPLEVIRPEFESKPVDLVRPNQHDPFSFLFTILQIDDQTIAPEAVELAGANLFGSEWEIVAARQDAVTFKKRLPKWGLEVEKSYQLEQVPADQLANPDFPAYHLWLDVKVTNVGGQAHQVAYRLQGPSGLPTEGAWYANKVSQGSMFSAAGLRDIITRFEGGATTQVTPAEIVAPEFKGGWVDSPLNYIAVDAQYFASALIPQKPKPTDVLFAKVEPIRVGEIPAEKGNLKLLDVSFRLDSTTTELAPGGDPLAHRFQIFAGPKRPGLLEHYAVPGTNVTLGELVYYGWFGIVARPMLAVLHTFHYVVGNYGIAIIMLTVLVRGCMFPLSRKQALGAQKMQELQPELKRINEKFKNEAEKKTKATQELFRQHNYNPVGGCLLAFVQLPIFVGLYRSLMVDVELRQAPLFSESIRWASNLAAPDMLWNWMHLMPEFITQGTGFFALGPYLNVFPLLTIGLFIWQQKMFMPPPADEQAAMQQKMMQYMMIFMGIMFYKVASGLCLYFIASSIWGIAERKLLPKAVVKPGSGGTSPAPAITSSGSNGSASSKKRQRGRK